MKKNKIGLIILAIIVSISLSVCNLMDEKIEFSPERWAKTDDDQRYKLIDSLFEKVDLVGMTADEIETMLGERTIYHEAYMSDEGKCDYHWGYLVKYNSIEGDKYLLLDFKNDKVVHYEIENGDEL